MNKTLIMIAGIPFSNGIPAIIISVLFMAGDGEWNTRYYY
jgi:hypothetical protein